MIKSIRGQAAMEFLMTYGWAILVVLIAIGALAYFGVLNPNPFLPDRCNLPSGYNCKDFKVINRAGAGLDEIYITLENGAGRDINVRGFGVSSTDISTGIGTDRIGYCSESTVGPAIANLTTPVALPSGRAVTFYIGGGAGATGGDGGTVCDLVNPAPTKAKYAILINFSFADTPNSIHSMDGDMFTKTETS